MNVKLTFKAKNGNSVRDVIIESPDFDPVSLEQYLS